MMILNLKCLGWFNIKMPSYWYRKSHCGNKTILRPSYLHNGIPFTTKTTSLYWIDRVYRMKLHCASSLIRLLQCQWSDHDPDSKVYGANMGPIWGRQDPGGPHVGPMNLAIWGRIWKIVSHKSTIFYIITAQKTLWCVIQRISMA